jgi:hypothetical protein
MLLLYPNLFVILFVTLKLLPHSSSSRFAVQLFVCILGTGAFWSRCHIGITEANKVLMMITGTFVL